MTQETRVLKQRRPLIAGLQSPAVPREVEDNFVYSEKPKPEASQTPPPEPTEGKGKTIDAGARTPLTTRIRTDFSNALKRASLQRQLDGIEPNTLQDILEEALEPWLRAHGYLN